MTPSDVYLNHSAKDVLRPIFSRRAANRFKHGYVVSRLSQRGQTSEVGDQSQPPMREPKN